MTYTIKTYKHFIFDFDGVISDSLNVAILKFNEIREEYFQNLPSVKDKKDMDIVYGGSLKTCLDKWIGSDGTKTFFNLHSKRMQEISDVIQPFEGIVQVLNSIGLKNLSIVTSSYSEAVLNILSKESDFDEKVIYKIAGRELHQSKTEKINSILTELELDKKDVIYVGDLESDILYCRQVPIDIISVGYGYHTPEYLQKLSPNYLVNSVKELELLINQLNTK